MEKEKEKDSVAIVLEISGKRENLDQYKQWLCEASLLHIDKVMFCSIWDEEEEMGIRYIEKLISVCESLGIAQLPFTAGYEDELFDGKAAVVTLSKEPKNRYPNFSSLVMLDEYKKNMGIEIIPEEVQKVFMKLK